MTNEEVRDKVEWEGLGYAVTNYMSEKDIKDPELKVLWKAARVAMKELESFLNAIPGGEEV